MDVKFSIVTINYNNRKGLEQTIESVINQKYDNFEFIIIDGGSNDGSAELLNKYERNINYAVSEKDDGIYNAMNKGIRAAIGEYIVFMNSGDQFYDEFVLLKYQENICDNYQIYYGNAIGVNEDHGLKDIIYPSELNLSQWLYDTINHQASAIKRSLFTTYGFYNEQSKITADWQFFTKMYLLHQVQFKYISSFLAKIDLNGISSDPSFSIFQQEERDNFIQLELPQFWREYLFMRQVRFYKYMNKRERKIYRIKQNRLTSRIFKIWIDFLTLFTRDEIKDV